MRPLSCAETEIPLPRCATISRNDSYVLPHMLRQLVHAYRINHVRWHAGFLRYAVCQDRAEI
jgi:hypothetical protein